MNEINKYYIFKENEISSVLSNKSSSLGATYIIQDQFSEELYSFFFSRSSLFPIKGCLCVFYGQAAIGNTEMSFLYSSSFGFQAHSYVSGHFAEFV